MPTVSILILTYNSERHLNSLFSSIKNVIGKKLTDGTAEVVVVDNNSTDDTASIIKREYPDMHFIHNNKNAGYAAGINMAAKYAKGDILVVINPDARLVEMDTESLVESIKKDGVEVAGMKIETEEGTPEKNAGTFYNPLTFALFCFGLEKVLSLRFVPRRKTKVDYVSGGFVAFRKKVFEELGGFDEDYFMYVEDMDICYRAKEKGYGVYFLPIAKIIHKGQGSSSREFAITNIYKGLVTFYKKHGSFLELQYVKNLLSLKAAIIIFLGSLLGKKELVQTYLKALKAIS